MKSEEERLPHKQAVVTESLHQKQYGGERLRGGGGVGAVECVEESNPGQGSADTIVSSWSRKMRGGDRSIHSALMRQKREEMVNQRRKVRCKRQPDIEVKMFSSKDVPNTNGYHWD